MTDPADQVNRVRQHSARMQGRFYTQLLPLLVLAVSLVVTFQLWQGARQNAQQTLQTQFDFRVRDVADDITKRMKTYEQVMRGVDGLFAHSSIVERSEFHDYMARLNLKENYPGIQAIRYVPLVPLAEKDKHISAMRKEGLAGYNIHPEGRRDFYAPVIYAEPYDERNKAVFGYDMFSDKEYPRPGDAGIGLRRAAMEQARDSGQASVSGKLRLLFEKELDEQAGFLMVLPVYRHDAPHDTLAERRANIIGWISSVFRMGDLMNGILVGHEEEVDIDLYDGETVSDKTLMHDPHNRQANKTPDARFHSIRHLEIAGHKWTMVVLSTSAFEATLDREKPKTVAFIGTASSMLLTLFTWLLVLGRERALLAAVALGRASRKNEMLLRTASDGIYIFDLEGKVLQVNDAFCRMLGYTQEEMLRMNVAQWNAQWPREELMVRINALEASNPIFETLHRRRDGSIINVEVSATRVEIDGQEVIYNSARDITERKRADEALRESEEHFRTIFDDSPIAIWEEDFSAIKVRFDQLRKEGITDFRAHLEENPGEIADLAALAQVLRINQTSAYVVGAESKEQVIRELPRYFTAESLHVFKEELIALAEGQMRFRSEIPLINSRGEAVIFDLSLVVEPSYKDTLSQVLVSFLDITERKRVEMQREQFFKFFTLSIDLQCIAGQDGFFKRVNPAFMQLLGFSEKELLERPFLEFIFPDDRQSTQDEVARQLQGGITLDFANRYVCKDGSIRWLSWKAFVNQEDGLLYATARDITERKKIDEALRESEERWSFALEGAGDGVWDWDMQTGKIVFSKRYKEILGFSQDTKWDSVDDWKDRVNPEDMGLAMVALEAYLDGKLPAYTVEYRMLCRDGRWKWMLARGMVVARAEDGRPIRMIGTHTDITERRQAAEAVRISEAQLRLLLDSAAEAIYGIDMHGNCTFCNPSCLQMLGYRHADELIGKNMHELIHYKCPDETPLPVEECRIFQAFLSGVEAHVEDEVFWRADGTCFPVEYWSHPQFHHGIVVGAVVTFLDISERVQANEKLLKLSRAVENSPASVVITNTDGTIEYVNPKFTAVTGYTAQEAIGQNPRLLNAGIQTREFYKEMWATILAGKEWQGEIYNKKKSGEIYLEHAFISPIRDDKDIVTHFVAVKEDITKRKQTEQELQKAMVAAEAASRAKGDFLANMSHEIRTPINAIIGLSHLCMQTELTEKQSDYMHKVHGSAKALLGIINDVLDFSKIEAGKMDVEQVRFELEDVMGNLATIISTKAEEKGLEFLFETSLDVYPHLIGDPLRLGQVLINLASNAVKFTNKGEVVVLTEVDEETADDVVLRFTVRDTGIGMTQEQTGKLFQAFTQADTTTTRKFGGTGLGLSISKRIVDLMKGKIWVESTPGEGSKFIFSARFGKAEERRARERHLPNIDLRGMRVLAVDDNTSCRRILESYLESFTFNMTSVASGLEALQAIGNAYRDGMPYQFVVLDWKMPEMDGIEVARKIREMAGLSKMPKILLISSFSQGEMLQHIKDSVVDGILAKPFQQSELFDATMEIFGRAEARGRRSAVTALLQPDLVAKISGAYLLLVEDNDINQQVAREFLEKAGVTVAVAENGEEAIARLREDNFDGVLMDMQMPVMDGIAATREIRKNPKFADLPIIAMTANVLVNDRDQCLAAGMNDHITKPLDPNQLVVTLAKWITPAQRTFLPAPDLKAMQGPETLPNLPGVRVGEGVRRMGGSVAGYCAILEKFRNGQQNTLAGIRSAIAANDWEKAERSAHTLKGLLGTLGAGKLKDKTAELESFIRGKANTQVESLLPAVDSNLTQLFAAIDRALQLRAAQKGKDDAVADMTGPVNMEELASLVRQTKLQLEEFDSNVEGTVTRMRRIVGGDDAMKQALASLERCVSSYNYEQALAELTAFAESMGISCEGM